MVSKSLAKAALRQTPGPARLELPDVGVSKKQNVSSPLTRKDVILWGASVTERIVCLKSVILFYSPFSGGSSGPV